MKVRPIIIIALLVIASLAAILLAINLAKVPSNGILAANSILKDPGYLGGTKLFLVSSKATYSTHNGEACFIIQVTVRNDYDAQTALTIPDAANTSSASAYFGLTAILYSQTGQIKATDVTDPGAAPLGVPQIGLENGQTYTYEIDMATSNRNVDNYIIVLVNIAGYPIP